MPVKLKKNIFYAQSGGVTPVINATANESIEPRHRMPLDTRDTIKTLISQKVNADRPENPRARN